MSTTDLRKVHTSEIYRETSTCQKYEAEPALQVPASCRYARLFPDPRCGFNDFRKVSSARAALRMQHLAISGGTVCAGQFLHPGIEFSAAPQVNLNGWGVPSIAPLTRLFPSLETWPV